VKIVPHLAEIVLIFQVTDWLNSHRHRFSARWITASHFIRLESVLNAAVLLTFFQSGGPTISLHCSGTSTGCVCLSVSSM